MPNLKDVDVHVNDAAFSQYYRNFEGREYMGYAIRTNDYRLVEWRNFSTGEVTARELFDHQSDHLESVNLDDSVPQELVDRLTAQLLKTHPRKALTMTPPVHSNPNQPRLRADISFLNKSETTVMVYPITPKGRRGRVKNLDPGEAVTIKARIGGVYVVESKDGTIHQIPLTISTVANGCAGMRPPCSFAAHKKRDAGQTGRRVQFWANTGKASGTPFSSLSQRT